MLAPSYRGLPGGTLHGIPVERFRYAPAALETLTHDETVPERLGRVPGYAALLPGYLLSGLLASRRVGRTRPDVVHVHWPVPHAFFGAAMREAASGETAMVCSYYSVELAWVESRVRWARPFLRWTIEAADAVTAISSATAARVRSLVERPVAVVPFAAAVEPVGDAPVRPPLSDGDPLRLLFVGRLVERKGVEFLVEALPLIQSRRPVTLTIVGEGAWEGRIRAVSLRCGVEESVVFAGRISDAELRRRYAECDLFVLPAVVDRKGDTEGLGVVLLEALRFGRPVIASAVGGIPDVVVHGETGWLVPPRDPEALARTVLDAASDPDRARVVGSRGRGHAAARFSLDRIVGDLEACYLEARRSRRTRRRG